MDSNPNDPNGAPQYENVAPPNSPPPAAAGGLSDNSAAAIAYLTVIPAILFLVLEPYNHKPFIRFHAMQCIAFTVVVFVVNIVLGFIPILGWALSLLLSLGFLVLWVMCIMKASKGEWYKLPLVGDFAMNQAKA